MVVKSGQTLMIVRTCALLGVLCGCGDDCGLQAGTIAGGLRSPSDLAADGTHVYWTDDQLGLVQRSNGCGVETFAEDTSGTTGLALDDQYVYWSNRPAGTINLRAKQGDEHRLLATGRNNPTRLAVASATIYWVEADSISALDFSSGVPKTLASGITPTDLAVDDTYVYFTTGQGVSRVPRAGGAVESVATGNPPVDHVAARGGAVYYTTGGDAFGNPGALMIVGGARIGDATDTAGLAIGSHQAFTTEHLGGKVLVTDLGTRTTTVLATDAGPLGRIAVDARDRVVWISAGSIQMR